MSAWPGKYVIGLTGNIATGKSVVRRMLEHLGAHGIDADALAHRAIARDAPGYKPVLKTFGTWILDGDGEIDRARLARLVFGDRQALERLEAIIHPLVRGAIDILVGRSNHKVFVIEAIKLLEGPLHQACDSVWVTIAPQELQLERLMKNRGLSEELALQRISVQSPQEVKAASADVVIHNTGSFEETWRQVQAAWNRVLPEVYKERGAAEVSRRGIPLVERASPRQAEEIAAFITRLSKGRRKLSREDIMAAFSDKAYLVLKVDGRMAGLAGWQVENLVARTSDIYLEPGLILGDAMRVLMEAIERASHELQCEALLLFLPPHLARHSSLWSVLGYEARAPQNLGVSAWVEAALESMPIGTVMFFKQLRKDRVLRPI